MVDHFWLVVFITFGVLPAWTIPRSHLYLYGPEVDNSLLGRMERMDHARTSSPEIHLNVPIVFYNETYNSIYVNANGLLSFLTDIPSFLNVQFPLDYPIIAPFYANMDIRNTGNVYYRETQDSILLKRATHNIHDAFLSGQHFIATSLFITTWYNVSYYKLRSDKVNTFQVVIANNGTDSYVEYIYPEGGIQWIEGSTLDTRLPDARAQVGMVAGDGRFYNLHNSGRDQVQHMQRSSNFGQQGEWMFHIGQISRYGNVMPPDLKESDGSSQEGTCSTLGVTTCHSKALCFDYEHGFCCQCQEGFYGNGINCLANDMPLRVNGKISGHVNDVELVELDIQSYVITSDGRIYTAVSRVPESVGYDMQLLFVIGSVIGWLFARPVNNTMNGYGLTGGVLNHTSTLKFPQTGQKITLWQSYQGPDVFDQLIMKVKVQGTLPSIPQGTNVEIPEYEEHYIRSSPGTITSRTTLFFRFEGVPVRNPFEVEHVIHYVECENTPLNITDLHTKITRNLVVYEALEKIIRYGMTSKTFSSEDKSPCREGRNTCSQQVVNSTCIADGYDYQCICLPGYQYLIFNNSEGSAAACVDVNECISGLHDCHLHAICVNEEGSYSCTCNTGYRGDGHNCIAESCIEANNCSPFATCQYNSVVNAYVCSCVPGYYGDGISCYEQDTFAASCNTSKCWCPYDFELEGLICLKTKSLEISADENISGNFSRCEKDCHENAQCLYTAETDTYECSCIPGYQGNGTFCVNNETPCNMGIACEADGECVYDDTIRGFTCRCDQYHQSNGTNCLLKPSCKNEINQCSVGAECVLDKHENYVCQCKKRFVDNGTSCNLISQEKEGHLLYLTQGMAIIKIMISEDNNQSLPIIMKPFQEAIGVAVDCVKERVYWSDIAGMNIRSALYDGSDLRIFLNSDLGSLEGISVDWISRNIYWTDSGKDTIEVANLDHKQRRILISSGLVNPRGIAVHPEFGIMFWSDWNRNAPKLESANLDGSERKIFLQGNSVALPNSLAIDWQSNELCWADAGVSAIVCAAISNPSPRIVTKGISYPFGLTITETNYFWTDWKTQKVESMQKSNGQRNGAIVSPLRTMGKLYGLAAVPGDCRRIKNRCASDHQQPDADHSCLPNEVLERNSVYKDSGVEGSGSEILFKDII